MKKSKRTKLQMTLKMLEEAEEKLRVKIQNKQKSSTTSGQGRRPRHQRAAPLPNKLAELGMKNSATESSASTSNDNQMEEDEDPNMPQSAATQKLTSSVASMSSATSRPAHHSTHHEQ
jgi:hypothetical protein